MRARSEFDHYNTLKLEDRQLTASEVEGLSEDYLKHRVKHIVKRASNKLKDVQISEVERMALLKIATEGLKALKDGTKGAFKAFYLGAYPDAVTEGSHKDLSMVNYYDYTVDPKDSVKIHQNEIVEQIQIGSDFEYDVPHREYGMGDMTPANIESNSLVSPPSFISVNKDKIIFGVGAMLLGALAMSVFKAAKR